MLSACTPRPTARRAPTSWPTRSDSRSTNWPGEWESRHPNQERHEIDIFKVPPSMPKLKFYIGTLLCFILYWTIPKSCWKYRVLKTKNEQLTVVSICECVRFEGSWLFCLHFGTYRVVALSSRMLFYSGKPHPPVEDVLIYPRQWASSQSCSYYTFSHPFPQLESWVALIAFGWKKIWNWRYDNARER